MRGKKKGKKEVLISDFKPKMKQKVEWNTKTQILLASTTSAKITGPSSSSANTQIFLNKKLNTLESNNWNNSKVIKLVIVERETRMKIKNIYSNYFSSRVPKRRKTNGPPEGGSIAKPITEYTWPTMAHPGQPPQTLNPRMY